MGGWGGGGGGGGGVGGGVGGGGGGGGVGGVWVWGGVGGGGAGVAGRGGLGSMTFSVWLSFLMPHPASDGRCGAGASEGHCWAPEPCHSAQQGPKRGDRRRPVGKDGSDSR